MVSTGCAGTNAITGALSAWQDGIPCLFISGQNTLRETTRHTKVPIRTYGQQELDIVALVNPITKYAVMIENPEDIKYEMEKAINLAKSGRKGPVWIDIPLDIQNMRVDTEKMRTFSPPKSMSLPPSQTEISTIAEAINNAKRPVLLIGHGVRSSNSQAKLKALIDKTLIPLVYSGSAPDTYGTAYSLSIGSVGMMGCSRAGAFSIQNADLILVLGHRLSSMTTGTDICKFGRDAKIIVVDIDKNEHSKKTVNIDHLVIADLGVVIDSLLKQPLKRTDTTWQNICLHWKKTLPINILQGIENKKIDLYQLTDALSKVLPQNANLVTGSGLAELILPTNVRFGPNMRCIHPVSQGIMGYSLPAAIGSYYASNNPTIAVMGDGSIMMNIQELQTIKHNKLPIKIIIINNNVYAVIRKRQKDLFRRRTIGTDPANGISCPDYHEVARAFGITYAKIDSPLDLETALANVLYKEGPIICEIFCKEDQDYINVSHAKNSNGRYVQRPLEDQAPFLDRELFKSEMIIEPIDQ